MVYLVPLLINILDELVGHIYLITLFGIAFPVFYRTNELFFIPKFPFIAPCNKNARYLYLGLRAYPFKEYKLLVKITKKI